MTHSGGSKIGKDQATEFHCHTTKKFPFEKLEVALEKSLQLCEISLGISYKECTTTLGMDVPPFSSKLQISSASKNSLSRLHRDFNWSVN